MASESEQWRALAEQFQVICTPGRTPGTGVPGVLQGQGSCGHWVNVAGLRGWVRALLDQGIISFHCPSCPDTPWLWQELCKLGLFSDKDRATLETQILAQKGARDTYHQCPRCQNLIQLLDPKRLCTPCLPCSQQAGRLYCFCWGCRRDWGDPPPQGDSCSNPQCSLQAVLYSTPEIQAPGSSIHGCPLLRACPNCHALVSHSGLGCPAVKCPECSKSFCYRCLADHWVWKAICVITGRQELNSSPQLKGESSLTPASTPGNSHPASPNRDLAPSPLTPHLCLETSRGMNPRPYPRDVGTQCSIS
uniref:RBR-type E3 ubiquitin transferase n=1 Tax=Pelusios castaneus TaxID=367368 RepID=A0A8C8RGC2_9SAUR